jgi:hypothetical protein
MKVCFIAAGPIEWGSSRMRAYWVAEHMQDATVIQVGEALPDADVYIWQKTVNTEQIASMPNARHYWDVCDPSWWWQPEECREIADLMDGIVASSQALADDFNEWYEEETAVCIPDRLNPDHFPKKRQHQNTDPVRFIWFGVAVNRIALFGAMANMERLVANGHNIELTIMDDRPDIPAQFTNKFPVYHVRWELDKENEILASHDIALLPPYPGAWGKVKSNNKTITAGLCELPVTKGVDYKVMQAYMVTEHRKEAAHEYHNLVNGLTVDRSAREWEALLCS